ncbi:MAG: hypothetical protein GWN84_20710 [Gammaproteobacteria bacterium]|nr:hypothetical protein [Gammaproteobacteria bacterium]NIR85183.1 hypothetical protein [Gammaproteobacteria bacterium]NIU06232.1 hypothetical protein [Gammaproteobacteria bacterium]NIX87505.1 hypothetical protein [Gammaproteobacteria bacterium]
MAEDRTRRRIIGNRTSTDFGLTGQLGDMVDAAVRDPDRVSMMTLGEPHDHELSIVVIKGRQNIEAFRRWAEAQKLLDRGRDSGMVSAVEGG